MKWKVYRSQFFFCHFFICSPNFHFFGHFSFILTIFKLLQDPLIQPHHNHPTSSAFIFQLELILNKAEGGDISTYVPNGEWDLIGKLCRQKCERTDIIKKQSKLAIFRNFGILERSLPSHINYCIDFIFKNIVFASTSSPFLLWQGKIYHFPFQEFLERGTVWLMNVAQSPT